MATEFPTDLDQYAPVPGNQNQIVKHRDRHQNIEDAMEAVQSTIGVTGSTDPNSIMYRLNNAPPNSAFSGPNGSNLVGFINTGTGASPRTVQGRLRDSTHATDFYANGVNGALVDPTGVVDSGRGIQAALNKVGLAGGGAVYLPPGTYRISDPLEINYPNVTLYGDGMGSKIKAYDTIGPNNWSQQGVIACNVRPLYTQASDRISGIVIRDIEVDQSNVTYGNLPADLSRRLMLGAVGARFVDHIKVQNVNVIGALASAVTLRGCYDQVIEGCNVEGLRVVRGGPGVVFGGNALEMGPWRDGDLNTYAGPYGNGKVIHNTVRGATGVSWPGTVVTNTLDTCNIGIQTQLGSTNPVNRQEEQIIVAHNTVRRCLWGIVQEGQNEGGAGSGQVTNNDVAECIHGIWHYGNEGGGASTTDNSYSAIVSGNRLSNIYATPLAAFGNNFAVIGNVVTNWGIAPDAAPFNSFTNITEAIGIMVFPVADGNDVTTTAYGGLVADNVLQNRYVNDATYRWPVSGIQGITIVSTQIWEGLAIRGNQLDGGNATNSDSSRDGGITLNGRFSDVVIENNQITGFARRPLYLLPRYGAAFSLGPERTRIANNRCWNNGWAGTNANAIEVQTQNSTHYICDNEVIETSGTRFLNAILFPQEAAADTTADHIMVRNNKVRGMAFGDENCIALNVTGTHVRIQDNEDHNYRTAAPASANYKGFVGMKVWNTAAAASGTIGWVCTTGGKPGTWKTWGAISA